MSEKEKGSYGVYGSDLSEIPGVEEYLPAVRAGSGLRFRGSRTPIDQVYARLTELTRTKGFLSVEEARELLRSLESDIPEPVLGEYQLLELLGEGATASVYRAVQARTRRIVALKILAKERMDDPQVREHFMREAKVVMLLHHPNIVEGLEIGETAEYCFIAMEYVDGRTLRDLVAKMGKLGELETIHIVRQVAYALEYTGRCDMVHTDIRPENIVIDDNTVTAKIFDLGLIQDRTDPSIVQIAQTPRVPRYSSPELLSGEANIDIRSDLYSLGLTMFFMLTGEVAFQAPRNPLEADADREDLRRRLAVQQPRLLGETISCVLSLLEVDRERRPRDADELLRRLERAERLRWEKV